MPQVSDVQFDGRLSNIAVAYKSDEFIADLVLPPISVPHKTGKFKVYDKVEQFKIPETLVGPSSVPNEIDFAVTEDTFTCEDHGLTKFVSQEEVDNADAPIKPSADAVNHVMDKILRAKEKRTADVVFDVNNYNAGNQKDIAGAWATLSTDALTDIEVGIDACFSPPNVMVMGMPTWRKLARNTTILAAVKGTLKPQSLKAGSVAIPAINQQELAEYLGLRAVLIGRVIFDSTKPGQAIVKTNVWDGPNATKGGAALLRVQSSASIGDIIWGAQFAWKNRQVLRNATDRGAFGGENIRVVESTTIKVIAKDVGYLFVDTLLT